jgi:hypothetical protein
VKIDSITKNIIAKYYGKQSTDNLLAVIYIREAYHEI